MIQPPRIGDRTVIRIDGSRTESQLVQVGLAEHHGAGSGQTRNDRGIRVRNPAVVEFAATRREYPFGRDQILDRDRYPMQRSAVVTTGEFRVGSVCLLERQVRRHRDKRIEPCLEPLDPVEHQRRQCDRGELVGPDKRADLEDSREFNAFRCHQVCAETMWRITVEVYPL